MDRHDLFFMGNHSEKGSGSSTFVEESLPLSLQQATISTIDTPSSPARLSQHFQSSELPLKSPTCPTTTLPSTRGVLFTSPTICDFETQDSIPAAEMACSTSLNDNLPLGSVSTPSIYSPGLEIIYRMTPLPSPPGTCDSPGPWNQFRGEISRNTSLIQSAPSRSIGGTSVLITSDSEVFEATSYVVQNPQKLFPNHRHPPPLSPPPPPSPAPPPPPPGLRPPAQLQFSFHATNRELDFESTLPIPIDRNLSRKGHERSPPLPVPNNRTKLQREKCLIQWRTTLSSLDSSPNLSGSATSLSSVSSFDTALELDEKSSRLIRKQKLESFEVKGTKDNVAMRLRGLRLLGQGAFSKVILATSEEIPEEVDNVDGERVVVDEESVTLDPRKYVAVKIIEHGAAGTDSKERVESGLKRELDILMTVHHPCLVRLKAFSIEDSRALLVLNFCAGGDLFDVASDYTFHLEPPLIRRMFAEIVSAVRYLHQNGIVHRDVKLENVLINLSRPQLVAISNSPYEYPYPITTLTDVGLSRRVDFGNDDLLTTRCGSDDYASPELIMGIPYDGRQTDAWALGVLLYALLEGRLPFDPPPGSSEKKMRSKTAHRIARCEWKWIKLLPRHGQLESMDGEVNDMTSGYDDRLEGGKRIVAGLMKRALKRWKLTVVAEDEWLKNAIPLPIKELED
ncbi:kinase-like protein [Wilcoxina mikolae CBS 423.85]|nr:kinase-like protein [Wilcoxina mikolae CBS 423.85]